MQSIEVGKRIVKGRTDCSVSDFGTVRADDDRHHPHIFAFCGCAKTELRLARKTGFPAVTTLIESDEFIRVRYARRSAVGVLVVFKPYTCVFIVFGILYELAEHNRNVFRT